VNTAVERLFPVVLQPSFRRMAMQPMLTARQATSLEATVATVSASVAGFMAETRSHFVADGPQAQGLSGSPGLSMCSAMCTVFITS
jgi:hypothetical protein